MVNYCVAINCTNRRVKGNGVNFHKFPLENKDRFIPTDSSYLCGDHFIAADKDFYKI